MNKQIKAKEKKENQKQQMRYEDVKFYRLMVEFILAVFLIYGVIKACNNMIFAAGTLAPILVPVTGVLFAAAAVVTVVFKRMGKDESFNIITSAGVFGNCAVLFFTAAHLALFMKAETLLLTLIITALLYFVYSIYNSNFFIYSLFTAAGFIALHHATLTSSTFSPLARLLVTVSLVLAFAIPAAALIFVGYRFFSGKATKKVALSFIISALALIAGAVLVIVSPVAVIYAEIVLLAVYLVVAVSYTVKLM